MNTEHEMREMERDYALDFRKLCQEAERMDRQALDRFRSWFSGLMDPKEAAVYTKAVEQCARNMRNDARSA